MTGTSNNAATARNDPAPEIPGGTRVLNTTDGQDGTVMNGFGQAPDGSWNEYEVETVYGIEIWKTGDFIRFDQMNAAD